MPRKRMLDPAIWVDEKVGHLSFRERLLFIGLITQADDEGRFRANPFLLRSQIFPYDEVTPGEINEDLTALARLGLARIAEIDGQLYGDLPKWSAYQKVQYPQPSKLPSLDSLDADSAQSSDSMKIHGTFNEDSMKIHGTLNEDSPASQSSLSQSKSGQFKSGDKSGQSKSSQRARATDAGTTQTKKRPEKIFWTLSDDDLGGFNRKEVALAYERITQNKPSKTDRDQIELLGQECDFSSRAVADLLEDIAARAGNTRIRSFAYFRHSIGELARRCADAIADAERANVGASAGQFRTLVLRAVRREIFAWRKREG